MCIRAQLLMNLEFVMIWIEPMGDDIERWIKFALEKTVSSFELDLSRSVHGFFLNWDDCYRFPSKLILDSPLRPFGSLTSLRLISVDLSDQDVAYFISNCQSLQHLAIKDAASLTYLNATTALKLKHLEIEVCPRLKTVDISNTNIESLIFEGEWETHSSLTDLPSLTEVSLRGDWCARVIWHSFWPLPFSQLQRLHLDLGFYFHMGHLKYAEVFPTLYNLKHLEVSLAAFHDQNIFCLTSLICASPILNSFSLKRIHELPTCEWRSSEKRVHQCLKVVEFIGWYGYKSDLNLVVYLVKNSVVLEKVIIDPKPRWSAFVEERVEASRECAKLLQESAPPGPEFVIL